MGRQRAADAPDQIADVVKLRGGPGVACNNSEASTTRLFGSPAMPRNYTPVARACVVCGIEMWAGGGARLYCREACRRASKRGDVQAQLAPSALVSTGTKGAINELRVALDLMARGFHVFRAMSQSCPCDLVAWDRRGKLYRVEVKTGRRLPSGKLSFQKHNTDDYDVICHVVDDGLIYAPPIDEW